MGGDTTVNRMGIRGVLNGPVDRHPPGIYLFVDKFLLQELILLGQRELVLYSRCGSFSENRIDPITVIGYDD